MSLLRDLAEVHRQISALKDRSLRDADLCDLSRLNLKTLEGIEFPGIKYRRLKIHDNKLKNLKNCPDAWEILAEDNLLESLEGIPHSLHGININNNSGLESLKGMPKSIDGYLMASKCGLKTLKGGPQTVAGQFSVYGNMLTSLIGSPVSVGADYSGDFDISGNPLTSLEGAPNEVHGSVYMTDTKLTSLHGIGQKFFKRVTGNFVLDPQEIRSHMLGLFLVKDLQGLRFNKSTNISTKADHGFHIIDTWLRHPQKGGAESAKDLMIDCQHELIENGFDDLAQL